MSEVMHHDKTSVTLGMSGCLEPTSLAPMVARIDGRVAPQRPED